MFVTKHKGQMRAIEIHKDFYNYALRYSCGVQCEPLKFTRSRKDGLPRFLVDFLPYLKGDPDQRRLALTILQLYKLPIASPKYTLASITNSYSGQVLPSWIEEFKRTTEYYFKRKDIQKRLDSLKPGYHVSGKNGPNGPALGTAYVDREAIRGNLESHIRELNSLIGNLPLTRLLDATSDPLEPKSRRNRKCLHSRISIKYEPGGKARPFAIGDFFTQSALLPIHRFTMNWLNKNKSDGTESHATAAKAVEEWTKQRFEMFSFDLTSATDRFPIFLQEIVISAMFGDKVGPAWRNLITDRTFEGPMGEEVRFAVGQPLGLLSSWSTFAITHHLLLQTAWRLETKRNNTFRPYKTYRMIGDDISIARNRRLAERYKRMLDDLDVDISINKSIIPEQCSDGPVAELAKRVFHKGIEVTPVPPLGVIEGMETPIGISNLIYTSWNRGIGRASSPFPVQSILNKSSEFCVLSFPLWNRLPFIQGVERIISTRRKLDLEFSPILNEDWAMWTDCSHDSLKESCRDFILDKLRNALEDSERILQNLLIKSTDSDLDPDLYSPEGGDWQPGPFRHHAEILIQVMSKLQEQLYEAEGRLWSEEILLGEAPQINNFVGQLHKALEPKLLVYGRKAFDEKRETKTFVSKMIKYARTHVLHGSTETKLSEIENIVFSIDEDDLPSYLDDLD